MVLMLQKRLTIILRMSVNRFLAKLLPPIQVNASFFLRNRIQSLIFLDPPRSNEILNIIITLKSKKMAKN